MCPGSRGADVSQSGCAPSAVPRRWRRPLGHGRPAAEPAGRGGTEHGEIRPEPGLCPAQKPPELGSPATGTRGSGTGVNGITPAEIHQVYQGSLQRSGFNRGLRRPEEARTFTGSSPGPPRVPGPAAQESVYLCSGQGSQHFPCCSHPSSLPSNLYTAAEPLQNSFNDNLVLSGCVRSSVGVTVG